jgi:acyl carrier protein
MASANEVQDWLIARICTILDIPRARVNGRTTFDDLGLDSITRAALSREIEKQFRVSLDPEALHEFRTLQTLAEYIATR